MNQFHPQEISDPAVVSEKNTKQQILEAYKGLVTMYKTKLGSGEDKKQEEKQKQEQLVVTRATQASLGGDVAAAINQVRLSVERSLHDVQKRLEGELKTFSDVQEAVKIQERRLKELYDVESVADTLIALLQAREDQKQVNTKEQEERKEQRRRDEEGYQYELEKRRRQDEDDRMRRQGEFETKLVEQKRAVETMRQEWEEKQQEFTALKSESETFTAKLQETQDRVREEVETRMRKETDTSLLIVQKEFEAQKAVFDSRIDALQGTVADQREHIAELQKQLQMTLQQIQEITLKTIDVKTDSRALSAVNQIAMEQARSGKNDRSSTQNHS